MPGATAGKDNSDMAYQRLTAATASEFFDRTWARGRVSLNARLTRVRGKAFLIAQCSVAAGVAWWVVTRVLGHPQGFFGPIIAVVCLGMTYGQRQRRVAEVAVGVAVGVLVADVFVHVAGSGPWQVAVVCGASMAIAMLLDAGNLLVIQSAVQSIAVATLVATPEQAFGRWLDAVVGGAVALVASTVVPQAPLRRPRVEAAAIVRTLAALLREAAAAGQDADIERAARTLSRARDTDRTIRELQEAADEGLAVVASSPFRRGHREQVRSVSDVIEPLDRAMRSTRVLCRRVVVSATQGERLVPEYVDCLEELAGANDLLAQIMAANQSAAGARAALVRVAQRTGSMPRTSLLSGEVVLAQLRAIVVDELQVTGLGLDEALTLMPPEPQANPPANPPADPQADQ